MSRESKRSSLLGTSLRISRVASFPKERVHVHIRSCISCRTNCIKRQFFLPRYGRRSSNEISNKNFSIVYVHIYIYKINREAKRHFCETGITVFFTKDLLLLFRSYSSPSLFFKLRKMETWNSPPPPPTPKTTKFRPFVENIPVYQRSRFANFVRNIPREYFRAIHFERYREKESRFFFGRFVKVWPLLRALVR